MKILAIETSCDETALTILEDDTSRDLVKLKVLTHNVFSQIDLHKEYGGVFPMMAKRDHAKRLTPMLKQVLDESSLSIDGSTQLSAEKIELIKEILKEREPELLENLIELLGKIEKPDLDYIAVTSGPGLEPALWVGINFARALNVAWDIPLYPVNHMEGHIVSVLGNDYEFELKSPDFPALALLISGGHTELVNVEKWGSYEKIGQTQDDAVGEAFDKVARLLGLQYPGGPKISKLATEYLEEHGRFEYDFSLPRPMLSSGDLNFSFSGLKTAVRRLVLEEMGGLDNIDEKTKAAIAYEFQGAVTEVLISKTREALEQTGSQTLIIAGGVAANGRIREAFDELLKSKFPGATLMLPDRKLATDNSLMIGIVGYLHIAAGEKPAPQDKITAMGNKAYNKLEYIK